jgi:hypothetical protein
VLWVSCWWDSIRLCVFIQISQSAGVLGKDGISDKGIAKCAMDLGYISLES